MRSTGCCRRANKARKVRCDNRFDDALVRYSERRPPAIHAKSLVVMSVYRQGSITRVVARCRPRELFGSGITEKLRPGRAGRAAGVGNRGA